MCPAFSFLFLLISSLILIFLLLVTDGETLRKGVQLKSYPVLGKLLNLIKIIDYLLLLIPKMC